MKTLSSLLTDAKHRLAVLLSPDEAFAETKFMAHRHYAAIALIITALAMPSLWLWDIAVDPAHAESTIPYRAYYLLGLPLGLAFLRTKHFHRTLAALMAGFLLGGIIVFLQILKQLDNGFIYGMTGFMYGMLISVLAAQCLPVVQGMSFTTLAILLPHLYAAIGQLDNFPHLHYGILMWCGLILTLVTQYAIADNYLQRHLIEKKLQYASEHDPLSGLGNRRLLQKHLAQTGTNSTSAPSQSLLIIDIDHFKAINDRFGHHYGDCAITSLARILQQIDSPHCSSYRIGGEEFAILSHQTPADSARLAEQVRSQAEAAQLLSSKHEVITFTVSIGLASSASAEEGFDALFSRADQALYQAKRNGRNQVVAL